MAVLFRSLTLDNETKSPVETTVTGTVPAWLNGSLYRNGAGVFEVGETKLNHLFDGLAAISRYDIKDGRVLYKNRILRSKTWNDSVKANRLVYSQFGKVALPDPCKSIFSRFFSYFKIDEFTDNTSVNVVKHGDAFFTMTEVDKVLQIDPDSLDPVDTVKLNNLTAVHSATAHPLKDQNGTIYNLGSNFKNKNMAYNIIASEPNDNKDAKPFDNLRIVGSVPSRWKSYYSYSHSFGMSENYFIILEQNLCFNLFKAAFAKILGNAFVECLSVFDKEEVVFDVLQKENGERLKIAYRAENMFCFHFINCFEEKGHLVVDLCGYNDSNVVQRLYVRSLEKSTEIDATAFFMRYVLPLDVNKETPVGTNLVTLEGSKATAVKRANGSIFLTCDYLNDDPSVWDLVKFHASNRSSLDIDGQKSTVSNWVTKIDTVKRTKIFHKDPKGNSLGEPVFVATPDAKEEDDGVLLIPVISIDINSPCYLTILNASTMEVIATCEVPTSTVIPTSFHGFFDSL
ncbi:retinal Mueller cells isomerohydrolase [Octopus bimaculoides]|uniref:retinal Mueller cells isomerohydrolase n=1 Tax=Octopus bimaculoides TaxID=37653 RepID=UPI00071CF95D|nr:retinal Mueller cells isomerohydrolase [Octopus bimaculoides]|eukprot:XP_014788840.1 PREDICTED: retinal Mueller cells isomerohydrolase-like [Octopus bimaculoides]